MLRIRRGDDRGRTRLDWLDSRHSFSFGSYRDPDHMGFRALRVLNDDRVAPGAGFGMHSHRDMEILTFVLSGALEHKDSLGHTQVLRAGELQRMTAGTGVMHSEYNASRTEPVHFLQIWILPEREGLEPGYEQRPLPGGEGLTLLASRNGPITVHQDVALYGGALGKGESVTCVLSAERYAWLHVATGDVEANGVALVGGDALAISRGEDLALRANEASTVLLFDLA